MSATEQARLRLIHHCELSEEAYLDYIAEWEGAGEKVVPGATRREGRSFQEMAEKWKSEERDGNPCLSYVPGTLYFYVEANGRVLGAIHHRHYVNERLRACGGNVGYGVRPSARGRGIGRAMLATLLERLGAEGFDRVMLTCDEDNPASARLIEACGGLLEDKPLFEGIPIRRYWIELGGV